MSVEAQPWEFLYEKHRALFDKAASQPLSKSERAALSAPSAN